MLCTNPIVFGLSVISAIVYGTLYLLFTTISDVFEDQYSFPAQNTGLTYLGAGIGQMVGVMVFGMVSDSLLRNLAKGGELKPEYRLPPLIVGTCLISTGLIWYGWSAHFKVMWMVPIIGMGFIGAGVITSFLPVNTYLVDAYTSYAASVIAANTVLRSIGGALLPLCGKSMYRALGLGWGNTLLAFIAMANLPLVLYFIKKGEQIRLKA
jgi:MFS family permease